MIVLWLGFIVGFLGCIMWELTSLAHDVRGIRKVFERIADHLEERGSGNEELS